MVTKVWHLKRRAPELTNNYNTDRQMRLPTTLHNLAAVAVISDAVMQADSEGLLEVEGGLPKALITRGASCPGTIAAHIVASAVPTCTPSSFW